LKPYAVEELDTRGEEITINSNNSGIPAEYTNLFVDVMIEWRSAPNLKFSTFFENITANLEVR
jgi:hypothetical protein